MARIIGPDFKRSRRLSFSILETNKEFFKGKQRQTPPGQQPKRRQKISDYALHLQAKQRIRFMYGINEKQFKNTFFKIRNKKGNTGHNFLFMLETRLDNIIFRGGFTHTRKQARQYVNHGHVAVNGKLVDIPSYNVKPGDVVVLDKRMHNNEMVLSSISNYGTVDWIDRAGFELRIVRMPRRSDINSNLNESYVVEYYNR